MLIIRISLVCALLMFGFLLLNEVHVETALFRTFVFFTGLSAILMIGRSMLSIIRPGSFRKPESSNRQEDES